MAPRIRFLFILLVPVALLLSSCRTYGGYGSEEAMLTQIEAANEAFSRDLAQARNDLRALSGTSSGGAALQSISERLEAVVILHAAVLAEHEELFTRAREHPNAYRFLNETLGGILADQELLHLRYRSLLSDLASTVAPTTATDSSTVGHPRYHVVPPYYGRLQNASYLRPVGRMSQVLAAAEAPAPVMEQTGNGTASAP